MSDVADHSQLPLELAVPERPVAPVPARPAVMVTGHRDLAHPGLVRDRLVMVLEGLGAAQAVSGGAAGADRLFAEAALAVPVPLLLLLPNRHYRAMYPAAVTDDLAAAAETRFVVERPDVADWRARWRSERWWVDNFARNVALIEASEVAVVVSPRHPQQLVAETKGGTAHCVRELRRRRPDHRVLWVPDDPSLPVGWVRLR